MDFFVDILHLISSHRFVFFLVLLGLFVLLLIFSPGKSAKSRIRIGVFMLVLGFLNLFFGSQLSGYLIYRFGENGSAVVVAERQTNNQYNEHWVWEYAVVLKTQEGETVETTFESWDFNIFPRPDGGYVYPRQGVPFAVKYLKRNPTAFVILSNVNSAYNFEIQCNTAATMMNEAKLRFTFDSTNFAFRKSYADAIENYLTRGCVTNPHTIDYYRTELSKLKGGN